IAPLLFLLSRYGCSASLRAKPPVHENGRLCFDFRRTGRCLLRCAQAKAGLRAVTVVVTFLEMIFGKNWRGASVRHLLLGGLLFSSLHSADARSAPRSPAPGELAHNPPPAKKNPVHDDLFMFVPAQVLAFQP